MKKNKPSYRYHRQWLIGDRGKWLLIALLVFAFPVGLYLMWSEANWKKWIKIAVSAAWVCVIVLTIVSIASTDKPISGGQEIIARSKGSVGTSMSENTVMLAPLKPDGLQDKSNVITNVSDSKLISEPTPTPVPTMVYCNDNGKYYHLADCRYVYSTTPRVTLTAAKNAGKTACPTCKPPTEETYEN